MLPPGAQTQLIDIQLVGFIIGDDIPVYTNNPIKHSRRRMWFLMVYNKKESFHSARILSSTKIRKKLSQVREDYALRRIVCQEAGQHDNDKGDGDPERPPFSYDMVPAPAFCQMYRPHHRHDIDNDVKKHQFVADKNPICEEGRDYQRHNGQSSQDGRSQLTDVTPAQDEEKTQKQHRIEDHFHMGHHTFRHRENISEKMIEEGQVVHEVHTGAQQNHQNGSDECLLASHNSVFTDAKIRIQKCNRVAFFPSKKWTSGEKGSQRAHKGLIIGSSE